MSIYKTENGIFHNDNMYHSTRVSVVGSVSLIAIITFGFIFNLNRVNEIVNFNQYTVAYSLLKEYNLISPDHT